MKRFVFRLARLERLRELQRDEARARLARALSEVADRRTQRESDERHLQQALAADLDESIEDASRLKQLQAWRQASAERLESSVARESDAGNHAREAMQGQAEAARAHRVLQRLRERRHARWLSEVELEERKLLDEIHLLRLARRRGRTEAER